MRRPRGNATCDSRYMHVRWMIIIPQIQEVHGFMHPRYFSVRWSASVKDSRYRMGRVLFPGLGLVDLLLHLSILVRSGQ
ncbi:hypothetical protein BDZ85DRAFT_268695 [Elsinoe ampelina]|uniref:Uncharacterized protein n=1 Tax=Elsinoe ampelina TaxID=302913 RepID=A0A6A6G1I8_9PEZI|nr:hypothetical protein BDZ85DRAFT_268695 [Elsinoe ampelina]